MTHVLMPFVVLPLYAAFRAVDRSLIEAAESLGAGAWAIGRGIIVPLTMPGVIAGGTIVFMSAIGYYITPALMGGPGQQMIAMLIADNISRTLNWGLAAALSVVLLAATLVVFIFFQRAFGLDRLLGGSGGRGTVSTLGDGRRDRSAGGRATAVAGVLVALFLIAPIVIVFPMSLGASPFLEFPPESYSLRWFESFFSEQRWLNGVWNSLQAAAVAIAISVPLGTLAALGVDRMSRRARPWLEAIVILPMVVPVIILAVGLFYLLAPLNVLGSPLTLGVAHSVLASPFVFITVRSALQIDPSINVVYTINEPAAAGAYEALKAVGLENQALIVSVDGGCPGVQDVAAGIIGATSQQYPLLMASKGIEAIKAWADTGAKPENTPGLDFFNTGVTLITDSPVEGVPSITSAEGLELCWG